MPIPLDELNRTLIPRVLTTAATVAELLYLFAGAFEPLSQLSEMKTLSQCAQPPR